MHSVLQACGCCNIQRHEIRSLQSLVSDYKRIISDYGYVAGDVRSSYVKELLIEEYGETIGFKERSEMNKSAWVYDVAGGGDYIEAAISSLGISDHQLLQNLAPCLSKQIKDTSTVPWPPKIDQLEDEEEVCEQLIKLLTWLKHPARKTPDISPTTLSLASMINQYVTGKRTSFSF